MSKHDFSHLPPAWQDCIEAFLVATQDHSGSVDSRELYACTLARFLADGRLPSEYTRGDVQRFLIAPSTSPRNRGAAITENTRNSRLQILNSFYKFCAEYEVEPGKPITSHFPTFGIKYLKVTNHPRTLSVDDLEKILSQLPGNDEKSSRDRAIIIAYWLTGKRRSELARLTWGDLEFTTIVDPDGTRRPGVTFAYTSKGKSREVQHAELPRVAWLSLEHYLKVSGRWEHMQPSDPLFTSSRQHKGECALNREWINKIFKTAAAAAGLDASQLSIHVLRHSIARTRYLDGQDLVSLKDFLGHSSLQTTFLYITSLTSTSDSFALKLEQKYAFLNAQ